MKKIICFFILLTALASCVSKNDTTVIKGEASEFNGKKIYLYEVVNQRMNYNKVIDSAEVKNNLFVFNIKSAQPQIYYIGINSEEGGYVFAEGKEITLKLVMQKEEGFTWEVHGSPIHEKYVKFEYQQKEIENPKILDSLNRLFYKARDRGDKEEMIRIKDLAMPHYENAEKNYLEFVKKQIDAEKENVFGLYLYYQNMYINKQFLTEAEVDAEKKYLQDFGAEAQKSVYMDKIKESLKRHLNCAVGHQAPEITGVDTTGKQVKLSDFRGKYVLVDFWNSYCTWCRKETPTMQKVYDKYKDKNFTILGVSSDRKKSDWVKAIHEDKSYWNHLITEPKVQFEIDKAYCITGIPHIILVAPDGKIIAKELRGEELIKTVEKTMK